MKLIDTHNHLYLEEFDPEQDALVDAALKSGIDTLLLPNVDLTTIDRMHNLCDRFPGFAYPMMGLHPTSVDEHYAEALKKTESYLGKRPYCAIGEIGIDLYWDKTYLKEQKIVFEEQLKWSIDLRLPVAIHTRDAYPEVLESIHKVGADKLTGVFHSFTGTITDLEEIKKLKKFKLGINGVITFKNSKLSDTILSTDINSIVLETDAPYLAPVPYRGKRNEPVYIWKTAEKVADTYGLTLDETVELTRKNALDLFKITNKHA
ncbi:TatD family hydrolase [Parabacteroides sp. HGS0025]|jgi:TatD DNase family protein|uniref:TatD family hydrolase n=1 Tax=Parabacteroides sp. HGS0025 TaxID=1078087 RepID=UPI000616F83C|nr:TatD family hydrolase [Parabacteroides sp. HGS0025]KKB52341.1 TatD family hydrolase [Parabacteroides sp. HGS0025]